VGKYSDAYAISVVAIWSFFLSFSLFSFRIQRLRAINHAAAAPCRAAKLRPERQETSAWCELTCLLRSLIR